MEYFNLNHLEIQRRHVKSKQLTNEQRQAILQQLLLSIENKEKLEHGAINKIAAAFHVSRLTVSRIWHIAQAQYREGKIYVDVSPKKKEKCGRKRKDYSNNLAEIKNIPLNRRGTFRSLSFAIDIPKSTLFNIFKRGKCFKRISSTVKPTLTDRNKLERLKFCLSKVDQTCNGHFLFDDLYDYVHIDEKWFYITKVKRSYYIMLDEEEPSRNCKNKRFITKVMFMAAVARPRYDKHRKHFFDGKIGIWPFVYQEPAQRNSKNRTKGTLITKNVESITTEQCKKMIIENVIPEIKSKFPGNYKNKTIYVQQDNARPHSSDNDQDIVAAGSSDGWNIRFKSQPPNSPDLNVLDLGFFNSIQSLQHEASPNTIDELIDCVQHAFNKLERNTLDNVFITLQRCMELIMLSGGRNSYKIPHINKTKLRNEGLLAEKSICSEEAFNKAKSHYENFELD